MEVRELLQIQKTKYIHQLIGAKENNSNPENLHSAWLAKLCGSAHGCIVPALVTCATR